MRVRAEQGGKGVRGAKVALPCLSTTTATPPAFSTGVAFPVPIEKLPTKPSRDFIYFFFKEVKNPWDYYLLFALLFRVDVCCTKLRGRNISSR